MNKRHRFAAIFILFWVIYFAIFWSQAIYTDPQGNIFAGHINIWGDWAAHFTIGSQLATHDLIPQQSPFLINHTLSYPFVADAISAALIRIGVPFFLSFIVPSFLGSIAIVILLFVLYQTIFKSEKVAITASLLFLLNGGLGFRYYLKDIAQSATPWLTAINPPHEYTNMEQLFYRWISVIDSMIIPQRAFTLGFPLALVILILVFRHRQQHSISLIKIIIPAVLFGVLPIVHTHSFLAVSLILSCWGVGELLTSKHPQQAWRYWSTLGTLSALIAIPIIYKFFWNQVTGTSFIQWFPGWYAHQFSEINWLTFWWQNWGIVPPLAIAGLYLYSHSTTKSGKSSWNWHRVAVFVPFLLIFALLNLFLFQPFIWDNTKLLVWASVGFAGLAAFALKSIWNWRKSVAVILFSLAIFSGTIDAYRILRVELHSFQMYSLEEYNLADWAKQNTSSQSIWLTGDQHNHWLFNLTGRQSLLTYRGWLWTHGYNYTEIEDDVMQMYQHPLENQGLFTAYQVDYIVVGPNELYVWQANQTDLSKLPGISVVKVTPNYWIYSLTDAARSTN